MARIGYGRVSTRDQNPDHQHDALTAAGCDRIFVDKASGKLTQRPALDAALEYARSGDQLVITRLSRLSRSVRHLLALSDRLQERDIDLVVLTQGIDTSTALGRFFFTVTAAIAELDREMIVEGTLDGLASARARGRVGGRPAKLSARQREQARKMYDEAGEDGSRRHTLDTVAKTFNVSRATMYRALNADELAKVDVP